MLRYFCTFSRVLWVFIFPYLLDLFGRNRSKTTVQWANRANAIAEICCKRSNKHEKITANNSDGVSTWQINLVFVCDGVSTWQIRDLFVMCSRHAHATTECGKFIVGSRPMRMREYTVLHNKVIYITCLSYGTSRGR